MVKRKGQEEEQIKGKGDQPRIRLVACFRSAYPSSQKMVEKHSIKHRQNRGISVG